MNGPMVLCIVRGVASKLQDHCIATQRLYAGAHRMRHRIWDVRDDAKAAAIDDIEDEVRQSDAVLIVHNNAEILADAPDFRLEFEADGGVAVLQAVSNDDAGPVVAFRPAALPAGAIREVLKAAAYGEAADRLPGAGVLSERWNAERPDVRTGSYLFRHTRKSAPFFQSESGLVELSTAVPARSVDELARRADYLMLSANYSAVMVSPENQGMAQGLKKTLAAIAQARALQLPELADDDIEGWARRYRQLTGRLDVPTIDVLSRLCATAMYAVEAVAEPDHISAAIKAASLQRRRIVTADIAHGATTVDALCAEHEIPRLDILRLDAASLAAEVVRDARGVLRHSPDCLLLVEIDPQQLAARGKQVRDVIWAMRSLGFYGRQIRDDFALGPFSSFDGGASGYYLFARPDRWLTVMRTLTGGYQPAGRDDGLDMTVDLTNAD